MYKIRSILMIVALIATQQIFAEDMSSPQSRPCTIIAKACLSAGYARANMPSKKFWFECMKPIILGKTVTGVTIDPSVAKACRMDKIQELKMELDELQKAS